MTNYKKNSYYKYSRYKQNKLEYKKKFGFAELILNQCMICSLVLVSILILNIIPGLKKIRDDLKAQLVKNILPENLDKLDNIKINPEKIKLLAINIFEPITDYISDNSDKKTLQENYLIEQELLNQMQQESQKYKSIESNKKNPDNQIKEQAKNQIKKKI